MASQSSVNQLARTGQTMRKLRRENRVPLFCGGADYRTSVSRDLAKIPVADGDCVLDFHFVPDHWDFYRFRAFHHT